MWIPPRIGPLGSSPGPDLLVSVFFYITCDLIRTPGKLHARKLMVEPKWDMEGGESLEAAIDRYKTEAIPKFLDLIVKEAKTDNYMVKNPLLPPLLTSSSVFPIQVTHILGVYARKFFWTYFTDECKKAKKTTRTE